MWAAQAAKLGYRWKVGNGKKVRLWEDNWLGPSSLAIQFWPLYRIVVEQGKTIADLWDGNVLKCSFRRNLSPELYGVWLEVKELVSTIHLSNDEDSLIWQFSTKGTYSSQSLYKIINFRGIHLVHIPALWSIKVPLRVLFFLWLLANNRVLTRDNLAKMREVNDPTCFFCDEKESVSHLFFHYCVAKHVWEFISVWLNRVVGTDFEFVASLRIANKNFMVCNTVTSAVIWVIWKLRNSLCFQGVPWSGMNKVFAMVGRMLRSWLPMFKLDI